MLFIGKDKLVHFFGNVFIVTAIGGLGIKFGASKTLSLMVAFNIAVCISIWKELSDDFFDWKDILADVLGMFVGVLMVGGMF